MSSRNQVREHRRLTQQQLSEKSGIDQGHISRIERGEKGLAMEKLAAIARALGSSVAKLTASAVANRQPKMANSSSPAPRSWPTTKPRPACGPGQR